MTGLLIVVGYFVVMGLLLWGMSRYDKRRPYLHHRPPPARGLTYPRMMRPEDDID